MLALIEKRHLNKCPKREYLIPGRLQRTDVEISLKSFLICTSARAGRGYPTNFWVKVSLRGFETLTLFRTLSLGQDKILKYIENLAKMYYVFFT